MGRNGWRLPVALSVVAFALISAAGAGEKGASPLRIGKVTVTAFAESLNKPLERAWCGAVERLTLKDKLLLSVDVELTVEWSEKLSRARVDGKDVQLLNDKGQPYPGLRRSFGRLDDGSPSFYAYRPSNWKDKAKVKPKKYAAMFLVPRGVTSAKLQIGKAPPANVTIPQRVETPQPPPAAAPALPARCAAVQLLDAAVVDEVNGRARIGREELKTTITNPQGKLLKIKLKVTPIRGNNDDNPERFSYSTNDFGLSYGDGAFVLAAGSQFRDYVSAYVSGSLRPSRGKWKGEEMTLYFAIPAGLKAARLTYLMTAVANISPGGPAVK